MTRHGRSTLCPETCCNRSTDTRWKSLVTILRVLQAMMWRRCQRGGAGHLGVLRLLHRPLLLTRLSEGALAGTQDGPARVSRSVRNSELRLQHGLCCCFMVSPHTRICGEPRGVKCVQQTDLDV